MTKRMLIDATHEEETRVAVMDGDRLIEFDYESKFRKPLKGSIFLAKVTRVEPSLQAAFVNFGGNRHGFLPFSEIHPDYFRIPISDREALMAEQQAELEALEKEEEEEEAEAAKEGEAQEKDDILVEDHDEEEHDEEHSHEDEDVNGNVDPDKVEAEEDDDSRGNNRGRGRNRGGRGRGRQGGRGRGGRGRQAHGSKRSEKYDDDGEPKSFRFNLRRKYKIQEVIKRGQIMLVQVSKEERGNKGAAVTSYLSLPGRYSVLMPNSPRAGGVSRKISSYKDRARMKEILNELEIPSGMSIIMRTAGVSRTKTEIKRDLDYLMRLWNNIREGTLESSAPALIYEEADLIKRAVRDIYTREMDEVIVAGEEGYKNAKNFMKMMIPSHAKRVQEFKDDGIPLFSKFQAEVEIADIGKTQVTLPSGGYLVINPTEALVSVDVNSGKATKERHIEETALNTNLEAAVEVCRQLRLRDLGGLVVVDFIDMEDRRNNGKVERKMREMLSHDRARTQMTRISMFGLMEISRQRMNPSLTESQFETCHECQGMGRVRSADATSIMVLRAIEDEGVKKRAAEVMVHVSNAVALYILNNKRKNLSSLEERYGFTVQVRVDHSVGASEFRVEVSKPLEKYVKSNQNNQDDGDDDDHNKRGNKSRRGRRGGRGRRNDSRNNEESLADQLNDDVEEDQEQDQAEHKAKDQDKSSSKDDEAEDKKSSKSRGKSETKKSDQDEAKDEKPKRSRKPASKKSNDKDADKEQAKDDKKSPAKKAASKSSRPAQKKEDAKKEESKKGDSKKDDGAETSKDDKPEDVAEPASEVSNDDKPNAASQHETVNEAPKKKKKGWWSK